MQLMKEPEWMNTIRANAQTKFLQMPMPQERDEEWRYTDLRQYKMNIAPGDSDILMDGKADKVIFTDLMDAVRNHGDVIRKHLSLAVKINDKFSAFHFANLANGILVVVPDNKTARLSAKMANGGHTIITGENSRLDYIEEHAGSGFITEATEIFAGENSTINFASLQNCARDATVFSFKQAIMAKNSNLNAVLGSFGSHFHRLVDGVTLAGEGASAETLCAFKGRGAQHSDFTINAYHLVPHTRNNILSKGTVTDKATSVFRGLIKIEKAAQQTDSYLADHTLLLSNEALANSIPSLQIDANDVKASHGATVGQIDEEQLFYLMSRGLSHSEAEHLIVNGFFEPLMDKIQDKEFREKFRSVLVN